MGPHRKRYRKAPSRRLAAISHSFVRSRLGRVHGIQFDLVDRMAGKVTSLDP